MQEFVDYSNIKSLPEMFFERAEAFSEKNFLWKYEDNRFVPLTWKQTSSFVVRTTLALKKHDVKKNDRAIIISENRPEWFICDFAIMSLGAVTVPTYTTNSVGDNLHIILDSGAETAFISNTKIAKPFIEAASKTEKKIKVILFDFEEIDTPENVTLFSFEDFIADKEEKLNIKVERTDTACIIYTSGTGGLPKGVILSHENILSNCDGALEIAKMGRYEGLGKDVFLSILPLSHAYEHTIGQMFPVSIGAEIYYASSPEKLLSHLKEAKPTYVIVVPRIFEVIRQRFLNRLEKQKGFKKWLFFKTLELGENDYKTGLSSSHKAVNKVLDMVIRKKVKELFGGRLKAFVSGGAALNHDVGLFFTALGLTVLQGYGQTEAAPVISCNSREKIKLHTVGKPLKGVDVKIAGDGEILVKGGLVMQGYWGNEDATRECIDADGWLHTGDIGIIDEDGFIEITDRKKDIIVNSGGDNISPQKIEGFLSMEPEILQAMAYGDKKPHITALVVPDTEYLAQNQNAGDSLSMAVARVNKKLSSTEKIRNFIVADDAFSVENGLMTPTLKIRRHMINKHYQGRLEGLYKKKK